MSQNSSFRQKGVGLIEVLVAVFILAGGLLGLVALQTQSLRYSHESYLRTQASILVADMNDRLRVNAEEALDTNSYTFTLGTSSSVSTTACETAACSASALAGYDYKQWSDRLASQLPGGQGSVTPGTKAGGLREYTIVIQFNSVNSTKSVANPISGASSTSVDPETSSFTYRTRI
ncbi:type IV pilus modification protein PilV [Psychromonas sp. KJ10-10]|uniref:type IV pilus modification protein PilV n=1 Tax=Psychromonas sp. KJ10-10 TaxID=3391823 RepID=UPI0039B37268